MTRPESAGNWPGGQAGARAVSPQTGKHSRVAITAKLTVFFPNDGQLHILNAACPVSARQTRLFVPICRNFDQDAPLQDTLDFNHQVFQEDKDIVEQQYPEDLPIDLHDEVHIRADRSSITYRQKLAALGLGRAYTA